MSFGFQPNQQLAGEANGPNPINQVGSQALLPTPPAIQMPVPMPAVPPQFMPGVLPVVIGSTAPVSFITTTSPQIVISQPAASPSVTKTNNIQKVVTVQEKKEIKIEMPEVPSTTTVFVGNITEHASDSLTRQILMKCGPISSWKRVQGASGRLQAFGFCEYTKPESALRAMRLLNGFQLGDKSLLVKVDSKTREQLDNYKKKMREEHDKEENTDDYDVEFDENTKEADQECLEEIKKLISGNSSVLSGSYDDALPYMKNTHSGSAKNLEGLDMDSAKKDLVSKEIRSFRQTYKNEEEQNKKDRDSDRSRDRDKDRDRERRREREREERDREKEYERRRERKRRDVDDWSDEESRRSKRGTPTRERLDTERSRRSRSRSREKNKDEEDESDYEKRRLERVKREKEKAYADRLKEFEARERKKMREYEKQAVKDLKRKDEEAEERIHLREFLEDYDDDRDDSKYYRGSALSRRMRERELEVESDHRDKQREMEEIDEILRKRLAEPPIEKENESPNLTRVKREKSPEKVAQPTMMKPTFSAVKSEPRSPDLEAASTATFNKVQSSPTMAKDRDMDDETDHPQRKTTFGFGLKTSSVSQQSNRKLDSVFNSKEEENSDDVAPKKKLSKLELEEEEEEEKRRAASADEKKKIIRNLIEKIPTAKDELFQFPVKMDMIDQSLVEKRIKPWVNKKIFEYIGEQEPTLVEFICSKVISKSSPKNILEDVTMVLDDEAEVFVVKMWRLLIYETEAKHLGLMK